MAGIGVILNPHSKKYKKDPQKAKKMGFIVGDKASCKKTEDLDDLKRVAEEFKSKDVHILAISGGDGTIHCTLTSFLEVYGEKPLPSIYLLRGGTVNTIASTFGVKGKPEKLLSDLLVKYHEDIPFTEKKLQLTKINNQYGCLFGMGLAHSFMSYYYRNPDPSPLIAMKTAAKVASSSLINGKTALELCRRFDAEIWVDGKKWPYQNYTNLITGSIAQVGLNFRIFHYLQQKPTGFFHTMGFSIPPRAVIPYMFRMYKGLKSNCPHLLEAPAKHMTIRLNKPLPYMIDGDMKDPLDFFEVSAGPTLNLLC